jgi:hypothetical protein
MDRMGKIGKNIGIIEEREGLIFCDATALLDACLALCYDWFI